MKYRWRNGEPAEVEVESQDYAMDVSAGSDRLYIRADGVTQTAVVIQEPGRTLISYGGRQYLFEPADRRRGSAESVASGDITAAIPGTVVAVLVGEGDVVARGQTLLVVEAMKTQQPFLAPFDGVMERVSISVGQTVGEGESMARVKPA
jgi:3-methylcrotonyl-CoA carboxylase alpha subunit